MIRAISVVRARNTIIVSRAALPSINAPLASLTVVASAQKSCEAGVFRERSIRIRRGDMGCCSCDWKLAAAASLPATAFRIHCDAIPVHPQGLSGHSAPQPGLARVKKKNKTDDFRQQQRRYR